jgi:YbbR domain-containing protein
MKSRGFLKIAALLVAVVFFVACSNDDDTFARVSVNGTLLNGDICCDLFAMQLF